MSGTTALLRNEPVQARSTARLTSLLDAAAAAIDALGYERLTTAMVAERAGASIGTVYRYFPDRIAVLQSVSARALDRFLERVRTTLDNGRFSTWWDAFDAVITDSVSAFTHEPAFAALRFGDVIDLRPREAERSGTSTVAAEIAPVIASHGVEDNKDLRFRLDVALTIVDSLLARAFEHRGKGNAAIIAEARKVAKGYLVGYYGEPAAR